jgi:predicted DCC family thiol-disulfide oxidoreductase YuxK
MDSVMVKVIYDGDCPVCSSYVKRARLRPGVGKLELIDARQAPNEVAQQRAANISLDEGLIVEMGGARYHGAEALHRLALMAAGSSAFNRMNVWWFCSRRRAQWAYPFLRGGRNLLLRLLRRQPIG